MADFFPRNVPPLSSRPEDSKEAEDIDRLVTWLEDEFAALAKALQEVAELRMSLAYAAPKRLRDGVLAFADGTTWNPGSGKGLYEYRGGAWFKL